MTANDQSRHAAYAAYAVRAAAGYLHSMEHYGQVNVSRGDGRVTTPTYRRNQLIDAVHMLGDHAGLAAAKATAIAERGSAFWLWTVYAEQLIARHGRATR